MQHALSSTPPGTARLHNSSRDLEIENERLRSDLEWQAKDQMRVEGDLLAVMTEWREKVVVLQDRLEDMAYRHREEKEELTRQMRGMYSSEVVNKLERDLQTALNLRCESICGIVHCLKTWTHEMMLSRSWVRTCVQHTTTISVCI